MMIQYFWSEQKHPKNGPKSSMMVELEDIAALLSILSQNSQLWQCIGQYVWRTRYQNQILQLSCTVFSLSRPCGSYLSSVQSILIFLAKIYNQAISSGSPSSRSDRPRFLPSHSSALKMTVALCSPSYSAITGCSTYYFSNISGISRTYSAWVVSDRSRFLRLAFSTLANSSSTRSGVTSERSSNFSLKNSTNFSFLKFYWRLRAARSWRCSGVSASPPMPFSLVYMKEIMAVRMVRMFQLELQVSLWQCVKVVQMDLPTSKRPLLVRKRILGGEKGQSSGRSSIPWQKPCLYSSSSPQKQKWKARWSSR